MPHLTTFDSFYTEPTSDALPEFSLTLHEQNPNSMHEQNPNSIHDNLHGNRSNWDVICDLGTAIKQTSVADALTDYRPEGFSGVEIHFATENLDSRLINHDDFLLVNNVGGVPQGPGGTSYLTGYAEAVGLDSSVFHSPINNIGGSASPGGDDI